MKTETLSLTDPQTLSPELLYKMNAYWRAANYLSVVDVYYGMADNRIGVARLDLPDFLPPGGVADSPGAKV